MLRLEGVHTFYGPIEAVKGLYITVNGGEIVSLIGSNGAGKSTTLMTISGVLRPRAGAILFEDEEVTGLAPHRIVGMGLSQVPEGRRIFPRLTVKENLELGAYTSVSHRLSAAGKSANKEGKAGFERVFDLFPVLRERQRQQGGTLSGGEQQMLAIGRALMANPKMLLLDEPSLGLAPIMVSKIFKTIKEINGAGVTILLVEQNAHAALSLSHRGYVLEGGRITLHGTGEELLGNEQVKKAYLGE
ncbi:MAG TPA: ABC transporter ATP-binding protein [Thermodesulfovibrionales bacterium]|nr:ABC transporter ATP-binding protein [Thermodesulfovibrionales bacterium]